MTAGDRIRRWTLWPMLWKEVAQLRRDRFTLAMMIGIPAIQLVLFGYAIQMDVRHQKLLVLDQARTEESRLLVHTLVNTGTFDFQGEVSSRHDLEQRIARGDARAGIVIPRRYTRDLLRGNGASAQFVVDASDPLAANGAIAAAGQAGLVRSQALVRARGITAPISIAIRPLYNPAVRTAVFIVPGIIGVLLSLTMVLVASMAVVRERERGRRHAGATRRRPNRAPRWRPPRPKRPAWAGWWRRCWRSAGGAPPLRSISGPSTWARSARPPARCSPGAPGGWASPCRRPIPSRPPANSRTV